MLKLQHRVEPVSPTIIEQRADWDGFGAATACYPLEQAWIYGAAMVALGQDVRRVRLSPAAQVQIVGRRHLNLVNVARALRGPVFADGATDIAPMLRAVLAAMPQGWPRLHTLMPELGDAQAPRPAGLRRVLTPYHTILLDLRAGPEALRAGLDGRWRNRLVAAEGEKLRVEMTGGGKLLDWLVARNDTLARQRRVGLPNTKQVHALVQAAGRDEVLVVAALRRNDVLSAGLFLRHGPDATYYVSHTTEDGRAASATNLMLWRAIERLQQQGVRHLDLGGVDTRRTPGLAHFKAGLGGRLLSLTGTWMR
jgi:hypothetical protein